MRNRIGGFTLVALVALTGMQQAALTWQDKAAEVLTAARKAIGGGRIEGLESFSAEARVQRNVGTFQMNADVELLMAMPDKYARSETSSGGPMNFSNTTGFNGDRSLTPATGMASGGGGMMIIRMGPGGAMPGAGEKMTPEQMEQANKSMVRSARHEVSRLMLGWFGKAHPSLNATYTYAGEAESPDGRAHVIDVKDADGFAARLFIDQATSLPLMLTYQGPKRMVMTAGAGGGHAAPAQGARTVTQSSRPATEEERKRADADLQKRIEDLRAQPPAQVEYHLYFSDWTTMDGIRFPRTIQRAVEGTTEEEWSVSKIKVNPKIDPARFKAQS